jgi:Uma2 family endonuclease
MATLAPPLLPSEVAAILAKYLPASFSAPGLTEERFIALCEEFPDSFVEYSADGTVLIMPPTDPETSARVFEVGRQLGNWAVAAGKGIVIGPDGGFFFPNGARRSPDAAWFDDPRWRAVQEPEDSLPDVRTRLRDRSPLP